MDKQTVTSYGWIVIITLVFSVMLGLTTPFGEYVGTALVNTAQAYKQAGSKIEDKEYMDAYRNKWSDKLGLDDKGSNSPSTSIDPSKDPALNLSGTIPEGGRYITGALGFGAGDYEVYGYLFNEEYGAGEQFPETPANGDKFIYGDYVYVYNGTMGDNVPPIFAGGEDVEVKIIDGWFAYINVNVSSPDEVYKLDPLLYSIAGKPLKNINYLYGRFPATIDCSNITIYDTIDSCKSAFLSSSLVGTLNVDANATQYGSMFSGVTVSNDFILTGKSNKLNDMASTSDTCIITVK